MPVFCPIFQCQLEDASGEGLIIVLFLYVNRTHALDCVVHHTSALSFSFDIVRLSSGVTR
jgi:hypothetical protein